ncbi:hypothetical protein HanHA300_Chr02g0043361 [Helianthus annuus]|nr:hypothetical protein HanHA300_Chr02g0043361 [Helianthus annuus]KAJ0617885.1 hypothetical protein HanHA89_Chr02g0046811 [Helianthus annuus]
MFGRITRFMIEKSSNHDVIELYRKRYRSVEWTSRWRFAFEGRALKVCNLTRYIK